MSKPKWDLIYYIWSEVLIGNVGKTPIHVHAVSGGGRGRTKGKADYSFASFNPRRATNNNKGVRGGVIPPGLWRIEPPSTYRGPMKKPVAKLVPMSNQVVNFAEREYNHVPFLIHGRGDHGSDGCLVIEPTQRRHLLNAVERAGGATLLVSTETHTGDMIDRSEKYSHTA